MVKSMINYVIANWNGERRINSSHRVKHPEDCIIQHLEHLKTIKHNLDQITVVIPDYHRVPMYIKTYLNNKCDIDNLVILLTRDVGISYGSFQEAYNIYREDFSHYIFVEDDYVPIPDNFDSKLVDIIDSKESCGYLCERAINNMAAMIMGVAKTSALQRIRELGIYMHSNRPSSYESATEDQNKFSEAFTKAGFTIEDFSNKYQDLFLSHTGALSEYGSGIEGTMFVPIQFKDKYKICQK